MNFRLKRPSLWLSATLISAYTACLYASSLSINKDFDGDGINDTISYTVANDRLLINYTSTSQNKKYNYEFKNIDECSTMQLYQLRGTSRIAIDGSCSSQGGQIYIYVYQWSGEERDWCLYQVATGEKADLPDGKFLPTISVSRAKGCKRIGDTNGVATLSDDLVQKAIEDSIVKALDDKNRAPTFKAYIDHLSTIDTAELPSIVDNNNVRNINDLAYYLIEKSRSYEAAPILEAIVEKFPKRVAAKLNLADAYWDADIKDEAKAEYLKYISQMKDLGKAAKIPARAMDRSK